MAEAKPKKIRPSVLPITVEKARKIVSKQLGDAVAQSLGDGDVIDVAIEIVTQSE